jgi:hypothetical protein
MCCYCYAFYPQRVNPITTQKVTFLHLKFCYFYAFYPQSVNPITTQKVTFLHIK